MVTPSDTSQLEVPPALSTFENVILPNIDDYARWDIRIEGGKAVSRVPSSSSSPPSLLLPALCHPHVHLDKPYILTCNHDSSSYPDYTDLAPQSGSFHEALTNTSAAKARYTTEDLYRRGSQLLAESYARHGVTSMRAFVEVDHVVEFKTLEAAVRLKRDFAHLVDVQICLFAQDPIFSTAHGPENRRLVVEALDTYSNVVEALGTTPYVEQASHSGSKAEMETKNIKWAVDTALERGLHLDFHLDYNLDETQASSLSQVISQARSSNWADKSKAGKTIVIGHCTQLTTQRTGHLQEIAALIKEAPELPIHFVGLPTSDLFMMGRPGPQIETEDGKAHHLPHSRPRGTMQIPSMIKDFGLAGCLGVNNVGNAFTPFGDGDPLQLACWGTGVYQAGTAEDAQLLYECVSHRARRAIGLLPDHEPEDTFGVCLPSLLVRNRQDIVLPGRNGETMIVPARPRLSVKDVVWDPPDSMLRQVIR
ncbi:hypothetical protein M406DRAFT_38051 [Cryphonectria parasitica EP155]|uniref:Amidohydrolase-related domain-containing protein n=1 Tax=Cryphonectria parasitica (strain ATCC 38755 / EP155) TaxID=660469 RepID=A0A9P5CPZ3_CRYP1|nr:uncharacterized protein M406DRAFT_38051 [Cryphonectria parasitica EP155]KAF3765485.1 hypothetical protein M406DRAFT_38051 [Cryphonectria parasitica EP155]